VSWYALSNLTDGRGMSWRAIGDPSEITNEELAVRGEHLEGVSNPVWDAELQRPVALERWRASRGSAPQGTGEPIFAPHLLSGTFREPPNSIGSFAARLTYDYAVPSDVWTKIRFNEVLWDTAGWFDSQHGAFVAERSMTGDFSAGGHIMIPYAVSRVSLDIALLKNGIPEVVSEGGPSGYTQERFRIGPSAMGRSFRTPNPVSGRTGDMFEIYVRHNVGDEVVLSGKDMLLSDNAELSAPTAIFFMGMYETR
jgi:hypothetical protein